MSDRDRWEKLRRLLLAFVAVLRESDPDGAYTLDVTIVQREKSRKPAASL